MHQTLTAVLTAIFGPKIHGNKNVGLKISYKIQHIFFRKCVLCNSGHFNDEDVTLDAISKVLLKI
jgi:hypothetical protein